MQNTGNPPSQDLESQKPIPKFEPDIAVPLKPQMETVNVSAEQILETEQKVRPLVLDPIVIASFGDFHKAFKAYLSSLCKDSGCTSQSKPKVGLGGSGTGAVSPS